MHITAPFQLSSSWVFETIKNMITSRTSITSDIDIDSRGYGEPILPFSNRALFHETKQAVKLHHIYFISVFFKFPISFV